MERNNETENSVDQVDESLEKKENNFFVRWLKLLLKSKTGTLGLLIVILVSLAAIFASQLSPHDPTFQDYTQTNTPPMWLDGGTSEHMLGTDNLGRDMLSRVIFGTQISLLVGVMSVIVAGVIGVMFGLLAGYFGGFIDNILMRLVDTFLAIPSILFILVILGVIGSGVPTLIIVIGITNWTIYARLIRGEVLSIKEREFIKAANTIGSSNIIIMFKHILPNVFSSFIVVSTLSVATTIILEASLSFLGLGIQPPSISWGAMLTSGRDYLSTSWWISTFPGIAITITVLGIIFLGDWLRDVLDPRTEL